MPSVSLVFHSSIVPLRPAQTIPSFVNAMPPVSRDPLPTRLLH